MYMPYTQWSDIEANANFLIAHMGHNLRRFSVRLELYPGAEVVPHLQADGLLHADYWKTLNPYAYSYQDTQIGRLAELINALYGENYVTRGFIEKEPSVFAFETFDITLHTYMTRLLRAHQDDPTALEVLANHEAMVKAEKQSLTQFNAELFAQVCHAAKTDTALPVGLANQVEMRYEQAMNNIKSIQLRLGLNLRRRGIRYSTPWSLAYA
jgi:anaerobic magnesium-protoporphyrin IX monomethyl ester cyclase